MSTKLERIVWIDKQVRADRYPNAHKVQKRFGLHSPRVVYDDRRFMIGRLGAPMKYSRYHEGWYYEDPYFVLPPVILTDQEVLSLFLGQELFQRYMGTSFEQPLRMALDKIRQRLPEHIGYDPNAETSAFAFTGGATLEVNPELLTALNQAVISRRPVEMVYYSASSGQASTRLVDPYYLHNIRGDWYLIAYCHKREEVRDFLVGRIREWKVLLETFQIQPGFSLRKYLEQGFMAERGKETVDIVIRFDEYQARWIRERQWHPSQQMEELPSGGLILRLRVGGIQEVKRWIMGYGPHAEVLQPESLRLQFVEEARKMAALYEKK